VRLTSTRNPVVTYVRALHRAPVRCQERAYLAEGVRLVAEAQATSQDALIALYDPELLNRSTAGSLLLQRIPRWAERYYEVAEHVLAAAAQTESPAGVLAVLRVPEPPQLATHAEDHFGLVLDGIADPGNAGTILRTADAAGVGYIVSAPNTVDLYAPKVVRAGMGAHFRLPLYPHVAWDDICRALPNANFVAAEAGTGESVFRYEWPGRSVLVIGSEAHGLSREATAAVSEHIHIPMRPGVESLNASVAASIAIYAALGPLISS
jgi:TrmH family RNA methyltransferase